MDIAAHTEADQLQPAVPDHQRARSSRIPSAGEHGAQIVDAAELERRRLERGLRDGAERRLNVLASRLQALAGQFAPGSEEAQAIGAARGELDAALRDLRDLLGGLHPAILGRHGLPMALKGLAARSYLPVAVTTDLAQRPPAVVEIVAFYLVAEALSNTVRHAGASRAAVTARSDGCALIVEVIDDGRGGADPEAGTGLRGLADRVEALGGALELASPPGGGTSVRARFPMMRAELMTASS